MKKLIILLFATMVVTSSFSQKLDSIPLPDTTKLTLGKVYSDIKAGINGLSQSLKVPASHVYNIMVRQQITQSISELIFVVIFIVLSLITYKIATKSYNLYNVKKDEDLIGITIICYAAFALITIITICSFWNNYASIVTGFTNPEYGAIKEIISFVK